MSQVGPFFLDRSSSGIVSTANEVSPSLISIVSTSKIARTVLLHSVALNQMASTNPKELGRRYQVNKIWIQLLCEGSIPKASDWSGVGTLDLWCTISEAYRRSGAVWWVNYRKGHCCSWRPELQDLQTCKVFQIIVIYEKSRKNNFSCPLSVTRDGSWAISGHVDVLQLDDRIIFMVTGV